MNLQLRYAIDAARDANMPKDTIERAIKKGTGELGGSEFVELLYEGYGPGGAAILCSVMTDNRNRTAPEIKKIFEARGGNLGATNCVAWMFQQRGVVVVATSQADEEKLTDLALEVGADDVRALGDEAFELTCDPSVFHNVRQALEAAEIKPESAEISMVANSTMTLDRQHGEKMMALIDALEDHEDVQNVYSNFEMSEEDLKHMSE